MNEKFDKQNIQYLEPYHHLLDIKNKKFHKNISWGLEYYSYVSFVIKKINTMISKNNKIKNIAEVGCGDGKIILELAKKQKKIFFEGFDLSKQAILFAKAFSTDINNIDFIDEDFKYASKKYDLILCVETLEHIPEENISTFLASIYNNLTTKGKLILTVPTTNLKIHPKHYRHYTNKLLKDQTKKLFKQVDWKYIYNPKSLKTKIIRFLLDNELFILNNTYLRKKLISYYDKKLILAKEKEGSHLFAIFKKI